MRFIAWAFAESEALWALMETKAETAGWLSRRDGSAIAGGVLYGKQKTLRQFVVLWFVCLPLVSFFGAACRLLDRAYCSSHVTFRIAWRSAEVFVLDSWGWFCFWPPRRRG